MSARPSLLVATGPGTAAAAVPAARGGLDHAAEPDEHVAGVEQQHAHERRAVHVLLERVGVAARGPALEARDLAEVLLQRRGGGRGRHDGAEAPDLLVVSGEVRVPDAVVGADGDVVRVVVAVVVDVAGELADLGDDDGAAACEPRRRRVGGGQLLSQLPGQGLDVHSMGITHLSVGKQGRRIKTNCLPCLHSALQQP